MWEFTYLISLKRLGSCNLPRHADSSWEFTYLVSQWMREWPVWPKAHWSKSWSETPKVRPIALSSTSPVGIEVTVRTGSTVHCNSIISSLCLYICFYIYILRSFLPSFLIYKGNHLTRNQRCLHIFLCNVGTYICVHAKKHALHAHTASRHAIWRVYLQCMYTYTHRALRTLSWIWRHVNLKENWIMWSCERD